MKKAELFLTIIEDEYIRVKSALFKNLKTQEDPHTLAFYAKQNLQIAKKLAHDAYLLGKKLHKEDIDDWHHPNSYILYVKNVFAIYHHIDPNLF